MAIEKFDGIAKAFAEGLEKEDMIFDLSYGKKVADALFTGVSNVLAQKKSKDKPAAFVFDELNGNFIMGADVEYHKGKDAKDPGNYSYVWTFNKEDVPDKAVVVRLTDPEVKPIFNMYTINKYNFSTDEKCIVTVYLFMAKMISKWLTDNASESDINGVELEEVFQARVGVENGVVVKSIEPVGEIKVLIKDDASIEK